MLIGNIITKVCFIGNKISFSMKLSSLDFQLCCIADASVYGMMAKENVAHLPKAQWIQVTNMYINNFNIKKGGQLR